MTRQTRLTRLTWLTRQIFPPDRIREGWCENCQTCKIANLQFRSVSQSVSESVTYDHQCKRCWRTWKSTRRLWEEYWMRRCWCLKYWLLLDTGKDRKPDRMELLLNESKTLYTGPSLLASGTWDIGRSFCPQGDLLMYRRYNCVLTSFDLFQLTRKMKNGLSCGSQARLQRMVRSS